MILSDRDLRALLESGRLVVDPLDGDAIQPSSIDLRVGHQFRVFANSRHPYIDVRQPMEDLTELVEATEDEPFILHPGEFVLGSTLETVALPDDMVGRLEGKSSMGRLGLLIHSSLPGSEPVPVLLDGELTMRPIEEVVRKQLPASVIGFDPETFEVSYHPITGWYEGPPDRLFEVVLSSGRRVRVTGGHNLFTLDRQGGLQRIRTHELRPGTRVAIPREVPDPPAPQGRPWLALLDLAPESAHADLTLTGPAVDQLFADQPDRVRRSLLAAGFRHVEYYRDRGRLPLTVARQHGVLRAGQADRLSVRGSRGAGLPLRIEVDAELAWLLGLYVAEGSRRRGQAVWSNTDQDILDRAQAALEGLGLAVHRARGAVVCCSTLVSHLLSWIGVGQYARQKRVPTTVFGWPRDLLTSFLDGFVGGDGSREDTRTSLWSSSEQLVGDWLLLAPRLGRRASACSRMSSAGLAWHISMPLPERNPERLIDGGLAWDTVVEVRDTGSVETIYDLEVRPDGQHVENFLAGHGGVFVSNTAGFVDAGFSGHLTLELSNVARLPITIYPGMRIGQLALFQMTSPADRPYGSKELRSKYQGQSGPTPSRYFENFS